MRTIGIIAEFNPFHNGHKLLIDYAKKELNADNIVIIMSGNFVQRGEPAIFDKWSRTSMCMIEGADIVIELPVLFSTASAEFFAFGAVSILNSLNCVSDIVFGTECGNLELLRSFSDLFICEPPEYKRILKEQLKCGFSYPKARSNAAKIYLKVETDILLSPNNILAIEYLKALIKTGSNIIPHAYIRKYASYHSTENLSSIASATAIRRALKDGCMDKIEQCVPAYVSEIISGLISDGAGPCFYDGLSDILHYILRISESGYIEKILDVNEGLENRILHFANHEYMISDFVTKIKSKRHTFLKIQRALLHIILGITSEFLEKYRNTPQYVRILGFRQNSDITAIIVKNSSLPVIINTRKDISKLGNDAQSLIDLDFRASDIYSLLFKNKDRCKIKLDFIHPIVVIK